MGGGTPDLGIQNFGAQNKPESQNFLKAYSQVSHNFWQQIPLKMVKDAFCVTLKALFILTMFIIFLLFSHVEKQLE